MIKNQLFIGAALLAGVAIGYFASSSETPTVSEEATVSEVAPKEIADVGENATIAALRARIAELEAQLSEAPEVQKEENVEKRGPEERPRGPKEWRKDFEKRDPEGFARMTNHMARMRTSRLEKTSDKLQRLASIDMSGMSEKAKANHQRLMELLTVDAENFDDSMSEQMMDLSEDERRQMFEETRRTHMELHGALEEERVNLLIEAGKSEDGNSEENVRAILELTEEVKTHGPDGRGMGRGPRR